MRLKLRSGFLAVILLLLLICIYSLWNSISVWEVFIYSQDDYVPITIAMTEIDGTANQMANLTEIYILTGNTEAKTKIQRASKKLEDNLTEYRKHQTHMSNQDGKEAVRLEEEGKKLISTTNEILTLKDRGVSPEVLLEKEQKELRGILYPFLENAMHHKEKHLEKLVAAQAKVHGKHGSYIKYTMILALVTTLLALFIGLSVDKHFIKYSSERKRVEKMLRQSQKQASAAIETARAFTFNYDIAIGKIVWGGSIEEITGYTPEEFAEVDIDGWKERLHPDDKDKALSMLKVALKGKNRTTAEYRFKTKNGYVTLSSNSHTEKDDEGRPIRLVGILQDITDRERNSQAQRESEERYRNILASIEDGYFEDDLRGNYTFFNDALCRIQGYSREELLGMNNRQYTDPETARKVYKIFNKVYITGKPAEGSQWEIIRKDGTKRYVESNVSLMRDPQGKPIGFRGILRDISERKRAEEALRESDRMKSEFISVVSHELRTPMTSVKNAVDIIKKKAGEVSQVQGKFLAMAERNINRVNGLISNLLDVSKIEAGKVDLQYGQMEIDACVGHVIDTLSPLANEKSITLSVAIAPHLPPVYADTARIEDVLTNLISNAIKFTPDKGSVTVEAHEVEETSGDVPLQRMRFVKISVTDNGIGIPEERLDHIFNKFYQVESTLSRENTFGMGLGLAICKGIIDAHGGEIRCQSKEGEGSTFSFTLAVRDIEKESYHSYADDIPRA